jgi:transposase
MAKHFVCLSDSQWETIRGLVNWTPPPQRGVPRSDLRKVWNTIFFVLTRGCRWSDIPYDPSLYCSKSTAHRWLIIFKKAHVFDRVLSDLLQAGIAQGKINLNQVAIDGSFSPCTWWRERGGTRL